VEREQLAASIVAALREAGRVAKQGASVVIQVWGPPERCELEAMKRIARSYVPAPPPEARRRRGSGSPRC
jgi:hypothetical protein